MDAIDVRIEFKLAKWPEQLKQSRAGKLMMWGYGWTAGSPDGTYFLDLGYGPNKGGANHSRFDLPAFNELHRKQAVLADGPQRDAVMREANLLFTAYMPYKFTTHRINLDLTQPWLVGYRRHPFLRDWWRYVDIDDGAALGAAMSGAATWAQRQGVDDDAAAAVRRRLAAAPAALALPRLPLRHRQREPGAEQRQGAALRVPDRRDRLRPGADQRPVLAHRHRAHLRGAVRLRPPRAAVQGAAGAGARHARDVGRLPDLRRAPASPAPSSPTTRRSAASRASWSPKTWSTASSASTTR